MASFRLRAEASEGNMENTLYFGDNLEIMRRYLPDKSVDLVYADPPFKSDQNYNVLFKERDGARAASQIRAFEDTWSWDAEDEAVVADLVTAGGQGGRCGPGLPPTHWPVRHALLSRHDGPAPHGVPARLETFGKHVPSL